MDPDGLTLLASVVLGAAACAAVLARGRASVPMGEERAAGARLGFSDKKHRRVCAGGPVRQGAAVGRLFLVCAGAARVSGALWALPCWPCWACCSFFAGRARGKEGGRSGLPALPAPRLARRLLVFRLCGIQPGAPVTQEDLLNMVDESEEHDVIDEGQKEMINNIFELAGRDGGRHYDTSHRAGGCAGHRNPRTMWWSFRWQRAFPAFPSIERQLDDIEGIVYVKDLFTLWNKPGEGHRPARRVCAQRHVCAGKLPRARAFD